VRCREAESSCNAGKRRASTRISDDRVALHLEGGAAHRGCRARRRGRPVVENPRAAASGRQKPRGVRPFRVSERVLRRAEVAGRPVAEQRRALGGPQTHLVHYPLRVAESSTTSSRCFHSDRYEEAGTRSGDTDAAAAKSPTSGRKWQRLLEKIDVWKMCGALRPRAGAPLFERTRHAVGDAAASDAFSNLRRARIWRSKSPWCLRRTRDLRLDFWSRSGWLRGLTLLLNARCADDCAVLLYMYHAGRRVREERELVLAARTAKRSGAGNVLRMRCLVSTTGSGSCQQRRLDYARQLTRGDASWFTVSSAPGRFNCARCSTPRKGRLRRSTAAGTARSPPLACVQRMSRPVFGDGAVYEPPPPAALRAIRAHCGQRLSHPSPTPAV
jgi:hypothetical protein